MDVHFYKKDDLRHLGAEEAPTIDGTVYPYAFIADVPGDNPDVLGDYDNHALADRLTQFKAIGPSDRLDCESCCFYAYFQEKEDGVNFVRRLNAYISQKSRLIRAANSF